MAQHASLSRTQSATLIANGNVSVNGRREKASYRPVAGELVVVDIPPVQTREISGETIPLTIVFEDDALLVIGVPPDRVMMAAIYETGAGARSRNSRPPSSPLR